MISKFSKEMIVSAIEFIRAGRDELGTELGDEKVNAMLDAFDPALKSQVFMELLIGNIGLVRIKLIPGSSYEARKKISAIKAVRRITGLGLKEAKDTVDDCERGPVLLEGSFSAEQQREMRDELNGTGYSIG